MRIAISGGGTGGHISPLLAVAAKLQDLYPETELLYIGSKGGMEERLVPTSGVPYVSISAGKIRRYGRRFFRAALDLPTNLKNLRDLGKVVKGYFGALRILKKFKPDAVLLKGGYVSLPVGIAAASLKIPIAIHESDSEPGMANRFLARYADRIFAGMPMQWLLPKEKIIYTGNPVRGDITPGDMLAARRRLHLSESVPVVAIIGGSQGAHEINTAVFGGLKELLDETQIIHIAGERDYAWLAHERERLERPLRERYRLFSYISLELPDVYRAADLVVARASAGVMAEIAAMGKPSILIPHTFAQGHQIKNAQVYSREGAAISFRPPELTPELLAGEIKRLLSDPASLAEKGRRARSLHVAESADTIARELKFMVERKVREAKSR